MCACTYFGAPFQVSRTKWLAWHSTSSWCREPGWQASSDEACSIQSQPAEETSFLSLKGDVREDLWTAFTVKEGHATCTEVPPVLQHKVHENKIKFTSKKGHAQLTGVDFHPIQYSDQSQRHSAAQTRLSPPTPTAQRHTAPSRRHPSRPILRAQRIGHIANARGLARTKSQNRNEHGPAPRPPRQKQEPFATHSGKQAAPGVCGQAEVLQTGSGIPFTGSVSRKCSTTIST